MHRHAETLGDGDEDAAARGAVELGHHEAGDARGAPELLDLRQRVLADRGVEHEQHRMRRAGVDLLHHAHDLFELGHQLASVLQPPRGVDEEEIDGGAARRSERVEREPGRVGALLARDDLRAGAAAPDLELIDRGCAERVAGRQHHAAAFGAKARRELADRGGLARAVDADDQNDERFRTGIDRQRSCDRREHLLDFAGEDRLHLVGGDRLLVARGRDGCDDASRRRDAEVGADEHVFQLCEHRGVEPALRHQIRDRAADRRR